MKNYDYIQQGFRILLPSLVGYIGKEMRGIYKDRWWNEILSSLDYPKDLPTGGSYAELTDSLDIANCVRIIDRNWNSIFTFKLSREARSYDKELIGVRNRVSHAGQQDFSQTHSERALDTMRLLCREIDPDGADELDKLYGELRAKADGKKWEGLAQPASESARGELTEGSLLNLVGTDIVQKTTLTRKITFGNKTVVYPVYKVRLDALFFNDQNDRIATWISAYDSEYGTGSLNSLEREAYNSVIEDFIYDSNPDAIEKTQRNIEIVGQREPGVALSDGRIVDGNRRFTCLRRINRFKDEPSYFETVIMDMDIVADRKQIKLLELSIQHGEEKKVDYDLVDYAIGTYRDVEQTKLLTLQEYADSTNESLAEVRQRIEIARIISEFLAYIKMPEQYHVAREYQVYSLFQEMLAPLKQLGAEEQKELKKIAFNNAVSGAIPDRRKFIRDIKNLVKSGNYKSYFEEQKELGKKVEEKIEAGAGKKEAIDAAFGEDAVLREKLESSMESALLGSRAKQLAAKPAENVMKCKGLLLDIDTRLFGTMTDEEKESARKQLDELSDIIGYLRNSL